MFFWNRRHKSLYIVYLEYDLLYLTLDGYSLCSSFYRKNLQREGVCIFVKKDICFNKIDTSYHCKEQDLEIFGV
jgi:hypothetical protein